MAPIRQPFRSDAGIAKVKPVGRFLRLNMAQPWLLVVVVVALWVSLWAALVIQAPTNPSLRPGEPSPVSIQARKKVIYESKWLTEREQARAESNSDNIVYTRDLGILTQQRLLLADLLESIDRIRIDQSLSVSEREQKIAALPTSTLIISDALATTFVQLTATEWDEVRRLSIDLYDRSVSEYRFAVDEQAIQQLRSFSLPYWASLLTQDQQARDLIIYLAGTHLRSNLVINKEATDARKAAARASVQPVMVTIQQGESIVRAGDVVTRDVTEKLEAIGELRLATDWVSIGGKGLLTLLLSVGFGLYIRLSQRELLTQARPLLLILGICITTIALARLAVVPGWNWMYAFPLAVVGLLLSALFGSGLALFVSALLTLPIALLGDGLAVGASLLIGAIAGIFAVGRGERSRSFVVAGLAIALVTTLAALALALIEEQIAQPEELAALAILGAVNGAASAIIALGLYNVSGHIAGIVTPLRLMELAHPAQPLLRKLIREAPGTYYHSVAVGNLAESAAESVGADALLLRVASYYHDIGKTVRPYFFTDNQSNRENVHNDLDPQTSAEIIADHVRQGIALAEEAGLPRQIIDIIATHHGTSLIKHFYHLALQRQDTVDIERFRYPGPLPHTREQAIMMLADTVEATVRAKMQHGKIIPSREGTPRHGDVQTVEELVNSIFDERLRSGQLDQSPLTLEDLARIKQAFLNTLQGIYHPRVEYEPGFGRH
ncbi:MAG: HDIG domain-containing protein [Roseiflexaceae bacterium]